jgi:c-di-GMP-binding flagellar brake protein YcgR
VQVYFMNKTGLYSFVTVVRKIQGYMVQVGHSEEIKRVQRRKYYRKKVNLPVFVKPADAHERPVRTTFHDLGGGGASMNNPGNRFQVGDRLDLFFYFEGGKPLLKVQADVIRTSEEQSRLHLIFRTLSESSRDRIIGFVLQQKQAAPT